MKTLATILAVLSIVFGALAGVLSVFAGDPVGAFTGGAGIALGFWLYGLRDWV